MKKLSKILGGVMNISITLLLMLPDMYNVCSTENGARTLGNGTGRYRNLKHSRNRGENALYQCYCSFEKAYKTLQRPHLGNSNHSLVLLVPAYEQHSKCEKKAFVYHLFPFGRAKPPRSGGAVTTKLRAARYSKT